MAKVTLTSARTDEQDPAKVAERLCKELGALDRVKLATLFAGRDRDHAALNKEVRARLPKHVRLVGASTWGEVDCQGMHQGSVLLGALSGDFEVGLGLGKELGSDPVAAGSAAIGRACEDLGVRQKDLDPRKYVGMVIDDGHRYNAPLPARSPSLRPAKAHASPSLRAVIRASHGLPPIERVASTSVGHEQIERAIDTLFEHSRADGSVFALLKGGYGTGKTHFLLHLAARALSDRRPVFRLSLERLDLDLGHPERHLRRLLDGASLAGPTPDGTEAPLDLLARWTRSGDDVDEMVATLTAVAEGDGEAADAARRALLVARRSPAPGRALAAHLGAADSTTRAVSLSSRCDAYGRLLLWLDLLERRTGSRGPVLLIDEAENLYRGGVTQAERRTALRSLSFYCGGALPRACVVLAITPDALAELQAEAPLLLEDVANQKSVLPWEDATMLCRRLERAKPLTVPPFGRRECLDLAARLTAIHREARGPYDDPDGERVAASIASRGLTPRDATLRILDHLESAFWWG